MVCSIIRLDNTQDLAVPMDNYWTTTILSPPTSFKALLIARYFYANVGTCKSGIISCKLPASASFNVDFLA